MKRSLSAISLIFCISCQSSEQLKVVDFNAFEITVPSNWERVDVKGIDSYVAELVTEGGDTIRINFGYYSNPFNDVVQVRPLDRKWLLDSLKLDDPSSFVFSETPEIDEAQAIHLREYYLYDTIDSRKAKLGFPKVEGKGLTLVHFPRVDSEGNKLSISAKNMNPLRQRQLEKAFKSIKFK